MEVRRKPIDEVRDALSTFSYTSNLMGSKDRLHQALEAAKLSSADLRHLLITVVYPWGGSVRDEAAAIIQQHLEAQSAAESNDAQKRVADSANRLACVNIVLTVVNLLLAALQVWYASHPPK